MQFFLTELGVDMELLADKPNKPVQTFSSGVDVLDRAFSILFAFQGEDQPLTLTELSTRTGLYKSTLLRLAAALVHHRFLVRLDGGRYQIGSACLSLSTVYQANLNLGDLLLPPMRRLNEELGETISFHVREGDHRVCLYRINSRHVVRAEVHPGDAQALNRGAGGRVLLAFSGESGAPYDEIRQTFSYISYGERDPETSGISAPVFGVQQRLIGALGVVGPISRLGIEELKAFRPRLLQIAASITSSLGGESKSLESAAQMLMHSDVSLERLGATHGPNQTQPDAASVMSKQPA
jgi:DNA-binding IclR family transcriptional regulator